MANHSDTIERLTAGWSAEYRRMTAPVIRRIQKELATGKTPEEAVRNSFTASNLDGKLANSLLDAMGVAAAEAIGPGVTIKPSGMDKLSRLPWTEDQMPLSERLHGASTTMRQKIVDEIQGAIKQGEGWRQTAKRLYDGYGFPTTLNQAELPTYLHDLLKASRQMDNGAELRQALRAAGRNIALLGQGGAPNQALKAAYKNIAKAVQTGSDKKIQNAVKVGVEERSRYYAERIARTEMARAWAEGFWAEYGRDDSVTGVKWKLSSRHPDFDICDFHAHANLYNLGNGVYPKDRAPSLPAHPHCTCHLSPVFFSEIGTPDPDHVKAKGDAWLNSLGKSDRQRLLTIDGEKAWRQGNDWQGILRQYRQPGGFRPRLGKADFNLPLQKPTHNDIIKPMDKVIKEAENGGRHSGYYKIAKGWSSQQLDRAARSYLKQVDLHIDKINNPRKYIPEWDELTPAHQNSILSNWRTDAERNQELATIMEYLLTQKRGEES